MLPTRRMQDAIIVRAEAELRRRGDEIERKTRETDALNRKLERLLAAQPGALMRCRAPCTTLVICQGHWSVMDTLFTPDAQRLSILVHLKPQSTIWVGISTPRAAKARRCSGAGLACRLSLYPFRRAGVSEQAPESLMLHHFAGTCLHVGVLHLQ